LAHAYMGWRSRQYVVKLIATIRVTLYTVLIV